MVNHSNISTFELKMNSVELKIDRNNTLNFKNDPSEDLSNGRSTDCSMNQVSRENDILIKSPMVGTFYSSPSPESISFVCIGSNVKKNTVLCIIEAMKLMNEIQSEYIGIIEEILVKDGELVEYGQPLFKIKKANCS